jgi:hypothetical protein
MTLIWFGDWYYFHASTMLPVLVADNGERSDWGKVHVALRRGENVTIRPATRAEHEVMLGLFDERTDKVAKSGWVSGLGNFEPGAGAPTPEEIAAAVAKVKADARAYVEGLFHG